jgi:hypothetical protein
MLQGMDNLEVSCLFYVKVTMFTNLEHCKIALLTLNESGLLRLTAQLDMVVSVSFM